jgi:hypothetical protein
MRFTWSVSLAMAASSLALWGIGLGPARALAAFVGLLWPALRQRRMIRFAV